MNNFTSDSATKFTVAICFTPPQKKANSIGLGQGFSQDSSDEAHTDSVALAFGSPNFKMFPEPL